jgi:hypothetical protein
MLSNSIEGQAEAMVQARINGDSWAKIAEDFGLKGPSAARSQFTKLTGIKDYKIKGQALKNAWNDGLLDELKISTPKKVKQVVDTVEDAAKAAESVPVITTMPETSAAFQAAAEVPLSWQEKFYKVYTQGKVDQAKAAANAFSHTYNVPNQIQDAIYADFKAGKTLAQLKEKYGYDFPLLDNITWNHKMIDNGGDIWKSYTEKVTSKNGYTQVNTMVKNLKNAGYTDDEILKMTGIDEKVLKLINEGKWTEAPPGSYTYVKHDLTAKPPSYTYQSQPPGYGGYTHSSEPFQHTHSGTTSSQYTLRPENDWKTWADQLSQSKPLTADQLAAVKRYTGSSYYDMNSALRGVRETTEHYKKYIEDLDTVFEPQPFNSIVYRNVDVDAFAGVALDESSIGVVYSDPAFMPTSINGSYGSTRPVNMVIDVPEGSLTRYVDPISTNRGEKEVILPRGSKFMMTGIEKTGPNKWTVFMKLVQ